MFHDRVGRFHNPQIKKADRERREELENEVKKEKLNVFGKRQKRQDKYKMTKIENSNMKKRTSLKCSIYKSTFNKK